MERGAQVPGCRRRGLAPLELVLALPILLLVMALIVAMGAAANWKVRALIVARNEAWRHRWPRTDVYGFQRLRPIEWPAAGSSTGMSGSDIPQLEHDAFEHPVIRGPLPNIQVNDLRLDPTRGVLIGSSSLRRLPPLLPKLGTFEYDVRHPLLDNKWQHGQMGIGNRTRRLPLIYQLDENQAARQEYDAAVQAVLNNPLRPDLAVLDRDDELLAWYGYYVDFHPRMSSFCSLDRDLVYRRNVKPLVQRIPQRRGMPARMARTFLSMYRAQQALLDPPSPILDAKIQQLEDFLNSL